MPLPYYVSPEQVMQDKAEYALKGISRGRSTIAMEFQEGIFLLADNPSASLNKISEIYDRIAFAGAGKYSEFENLRKAGIRHADLKGFAYSREDVTAKSLANAYSQAMGTIFSQELKPLEVEILVVEVSETGKDHEIYRILFDGSINDERGFAVVGGRADRVKDFLQKRYNPGIGLKDALWLAVDALESATDHGLSAQNIEAAVLERDRMGRKFRRLPSSEIQELLSEKAQKENKAVT
ncbi:MAG: proteasome subunit alpha [Nitrospirae bacterium]|nr:proteasome subunit alpha [Nitrospirota bacterium]